jgi:VWFA-related protein
MACSISVCDRNFQFFAVALVSIALTRIGMAQEPTPSLQAPTIKVQVQQVLVPVVVTDRKGRFITDLKASDFQVFEDGVEQKLASFTTHEDATPDLLQPGSGKEPVPRPGEAQPLHPPNTLNDMRPHHTYLIILDTLNSSFGSFVQIRGALEKLFKQEHGADTQYAVIALGRTTDVIQNLTRDPEAVLAALANKKINKTIASSEALNLAQQEIDLRRMLEDKCRQAGNPNVPDPRSVSENYGLFLHSHL